MGLNTKGDLFKATKDGACLHSVEELEKNGKEKQIKIMISPHSHS